eukprot:scaffold2481_cov83-Cyclotella_meneghiniana.AAC.3
MYVNPQVQSVIRCHFARHAAVDVLQLVLLLDLCAASNPPSTFVPESTLLPPHCRACLLACGVRFSFWPCRMSLLMFCWGCTNPVD